MIDDAICFLWDVDDTCESHNLKAFKQPGKRTINVCRTKNRSRTQHREVFMAAALAPPATTIFRAASTGG